MRTLLVTSLLLAATACQKQPSRLDQMPAGAGAKPSVATPGLANLPGDAGERMARIERRLDKVVMVLEQALPPGEPDPGTTYSVAVDPIDPVEGPADAKITIIEGFEFLCPYCAMVNPTVEQLRQKYPNDVRVVSKYLVIHGQPALPPALVACAAAKQGKYTEVKNALWAKLFIIENGVPQMQKDQVNPESIMKIAAEAGADVAKLEADSKSCQQWISSSQQTMSPVGATGTPAFFVNGRFLNGAVPMERFEQLIQEEMAKADKAIADGVSKQDFYDQVIVARGEKRVKGRFED